MNIIKIRLNHTIEILRTFFNKKKKKLSMRILTKSKVNW